MKSWLLFALILAFPVLVFSQTNKIGSTGNVGVGIINPTSKFEVQGDFNNLFMIGNKSPDGGQTYTSYENGRAYMNFVEYDDPFVLRFIQTHLDLDNTELIFYNGNMGIGTNPDAKLSVKGDIHTQEVKVDLAGAVAPDYVFMNDYKLKTLDEVKAYINNKGHLPNIPSAKEMEEEGINLKEMNLKLLEKIEELTLYTIEQQKLIETQGVILVEMKNEIENIKKKER
ncbi:hypothetical protein [Joostella sp. CR20]|uniref:hypothetical protein n=1 Tax=Joostella sp. CR20 TaxID=2804312 RepID=UPI00313CEFC7